MTDSLSEREQVERLAVLMGWSRMPDSNVWEMPMDGGNHMCCILPDDWNPFRSASDDYMVLQRVRETWGQDDPESEWSDTRLIEFGDSVDNPWSADYVVGDWSRAALRVLDAQEQENAAVTDLRLPDFGAMYRDMAQGMPHEVRCFHCGASQAVDPAACLKSGWPTCCGSTMSLTAPSVLDTP